MLGHSAISETPISSLVEADEPGVINETLLNAVSFSQTLSRLVILNPALTNSVAFSDIIKRVLELTLENLVEFHNDAESQFLVLSLINDIALTNSLTRQIVATRLIEEVVRFEHTFARTYTGELQTLLTFLNDIARGENPDNEVGFEDTITGAASKGLSNTATFEDTIDVNINVTRELEGSISFEDSIIASIERTCDLHEYTPSGNGLPAEPALSEANGISFTYGATTLNLRNPEFGDETLVNPTRVLHRTRNGDVRVYRNSIWGKRREFTITIRAMSESKKDEVLDFLELSLGQSVTYVDPENRSWTGVLIEPQSPVEDAGPTCDYRTTIRFRGVPA